MSLSKFTDEQLLVEMRERFHGRYCVWLDEDIKEALLANDYKITPESIEIVWDEIGYDWLEERMCEAGYHVIDCAIGYANDKLEKFKEK